MKFKCNEPGCGKVFEYDESDKTSFPRCPEGHTNVSPIATFPWKKIVIFGVIVVLLIIIISIVTNSGDDVRIRPEKAETSLVVTISGPKYENYNAELIRNDNRTIRGSSKVENDAKKITFKNLASSECDYEYTLKVKFDNQEYTGSYLKGPWKFQKLPEVPIAPQITNVYYNPKRLSNQTETYTVTIVIDPTCKDNVEYSIDNSRWQSSNVFKGLQPNSYAFYARNTRDKNLVDSKSLTLDPFSSIPIPSINQLNDWLSDVANGNEASLDNLRNIIGRSSIKGVANISDGDGLINDASIKGTVYRVVDMSVKDGVIESVTIN